MRSPEKAFLLIVLATSTACAHPRAAEHPRSPAGLQVFRLLTYNVNYGIPGDPDTVAAIRDAAADLAVLQETNVAWERALRAQLAGELPAMSFKHRGGAGGIAVLAREPPEQIEFLPPNAEGGWFPAVRIVANTRLGRIQILGVHLRPAVSDGGSWIEGHFSTPEIRVAEMKSFHARLARELPTVVVGDFNEEEDGDVTSLLSRYGFSSALARFAPGQFTWRWPTMMGEIHKQLDHVFYDEGLDVLSAEVRHAGRSDHLPVVAVLVESKLRD